MVQVNDGRSVYATKVVWIEPLVEFIQGNLHQIRFVAYMQFDVIIRTDQPRDLGSPHIYHPTTTIAHEQALEVLDWLCLKRTQRSFPNRGFVIFV
jgi:hypothetical protein